MDANKIQQITERVSQNIESKGVSPDKNAIFEKLSEFINDYGIVPYEAERKILADMYKKYDIQEEVRPTPIISSSGDIRNLADAVDGDWVTVEVKIVSIGQPRTAVISQRGILADSSGAMEFVVFAKAADIPKLEAEKWYRIESAIIDSFRGSLSMKIHSGTKITELDDERCLMPASPIPIADIGLGVVSCIRAKFIDEWVNTSDKIYQTGLLADESGKIKFVIWSSSGRETLKLGSIYTICYSTASEFNGRISLSLDSAIWLEDEDDSMPTVPVKSSVQAPPEGELPKTNLHDLKAGYATIRVKFIEEWELRSDKMLQCGIIGDETGRKKFIIWKDGITEPLELNKVYTIKKALISEFNGRFSIILNRAEIIPETENLEVGNQLDFMEGNLVQIAKGSGLIRRCPVEGCNRILSKQNLCPIHEIQTEYKYDLRIRGYIDDGYNTHSIQLNREICEKLSGISLEKAIEIGTSDPLGLDTVKSLLIEKICGRYLVCKGNWINEQFYVIDADFKQFDPTELISLMNETGNSNKGGQI